MSKSPDNKEKLLIKFGLHLRSLREAKGISSAEMARRCLMDRGNYTRLESGLKDVQFSTLMRICSTLEINLERFFSNFE